MGEADFSFARCLAEAFGCASNVTATSLSSKTYLRKLYSRSRSNIEELTSRGCKVMHWVDATELVFDEYLGKKEFDRIVFNFPYAGFFKDLTRNSVLELHCELMTNFMKNAKMLLSKNGEIHITHKTKGFNSEWEIEDLANDQGLRLIESVVFNQYDYPGYNSRNGFIKGQGFNCYPSMTYKFGR